MKTRKRFWGSDAKFLPQYFPRVLPKNGNPFISFWPFGESAELLASILLQIAGCHILNSDLWILWPFQSSSYPTSSHEMSWSRPFAQAQGSSQPQLMAGPLQWWLRSTRDVRVVESLEVADLVVSDIFLKQSEDGMAIGWSLVSRNHAVIDMCCLLCLFDPRQ